MPSFLLVVGENPLSLDGFIDSSSNLQVAHGQDVLVDHDQKLHAKHVNLCPPTNGTMRIKLVDFSHGGASWAMNASHDSGNVTWSRDTNHAYCDFGAMTDALEVSVSATSNASPPATKNLTIWVKTMPTDGLPDRP